MFQTQTKPVIQPDIYLDENGNEILLDENGNEIKPSSGRMSGAGPNTGNMPTGGRGTMQSTTTMSPQDKKPFFVDRGIERFNAPLTDFGKYARFASESLTDPRNRFFKDENSFGRSVEDAIRGYAGGAYEGVANLLDEQFRPSNLATLGFGSAEANADKLGLEAALPFFTAGRRVMSAPVAYQGAINTFGDNKSVGDRLSGLSEMAMGGAGVFGPSMAGKTTETEPVIDTAPLGKRSTPRIIGEGVNPPQDWNEVVKRATELLGADASKMDPKRLLGQLSLFDPKTDPEAAYLANSVGRMIRSGNAVVTPPSTEVPLSSAADELQNTRRVGIHQADVPGAILDQTAGDILLDDNGNVINKSQGPNTPINRMVGNNQVPPNQGVPPPSGGPTGPPNGPTTPNWNAPGRMPVPPPNSPLSARASLYSKVSGNIRAILTAEDLSAFRQAKGLILHPEYWKNIRTMFKAWGNQRGMDAILSSIENDPSGLFSKSIRRPNGELVSIAEDLGLDLKDLSSSRFSNSEWAKKYIPGVERSERAFEGYIIKLRADVFKKLYAEAQGLGRGNANVGKQIADIVNTATGSAKLGGLERSERAMRILNETFFAPRYNMSRVKMYTQVLNPKLYTTYDPIVRREALKSLLGVVGSGMLLGELAKMAGAEVNNDPTSSDFRKIKIGNTRIDNFAGLQQYAVAASKLLSGQETSSNTGQTFDLTNPKYGGDTRATVVERFITSKLAPIPSFVYAWMNNKEFDGTPFEVKQAMVNRIAPIVMQDLYSLFQENPSLLPLGGLAAIFGEGTQTYGR